MKKKIKLKKAKKSPTVLKEPGDVRGENYEGKNGGGDKEMMDNFVASKNKKKKIDVELAGKEAFMKKLGLKY